MSRLATTAAVLASLALLAACHRPVPAVDVSGPEQAALDRPAAGDVPLDLRVPADGTVLPWTFPSPAFQWEDRQAATVFRVRVRSGSRVVAEAFTSQRRFAFPADRWAEVREAAGEGGALEVELTAASTLLDGTVLRGPARVLSRVRFSGPADHPTGRVVYSWRARPAGTSPGPLMTEMRNGVIMQVAMDGTVSEVLQRLPGSDRLRREYRGPNAGLDRTDLRLRPEGSGGGAQGPGPDGRLAGVARPLAPGATWVDAPVPPAVPAPATPRREPPPLPAPVLSTAPESVASRSMDFSALAREPGVPAWTTVERPIKDDCMGCHVLSGDGRYLGVVHTATEMRPEGWIASPGTLYLVDTADGTVRHRLPGGTFARFHPTDPDLLLYTANGNSSGVLRRASVLRQDIRVANLRTGEDRPLPGASDPRHAEFLAEWSPDGRTVAFCRAPRDQPAEGGRGTYDIVTVPWNDGRGGDPTPLPGASDNGRSNLQPRYSPDGRWIVFHRADRGLFSAASSDLWVVPAAGGEARPLSVNGPAVDGWHAFSPDGLWLAFVSNRDRVDRPRGYVARFFPEDGTAAPALPLPGAGDADTHVDTLEWVR